MYYFEKENALFTGDTIMKDSIGTTRYVGGSEEELKNSIKKFTNLNLNNDTMVYPGHDEEATFDYIIKYNNYINGVIFKLNKKDSTNFIFYKQDKSKTYSEADFALVASSSPFHMSNTPPV